MSFDVGRQLSRMLAPLMRRIRLTASRVVIAMVNDALKMQGVQVKLLADEVRGSVERFQQYGLTSVPHAGAEGIFLSLNGSRDQGVVINVDDRRYRLKGLAAGEVALYDDLGQKVHLTRAGIVVSTPQLARIEAADIQFHASHSYSWDVNGFGERWTHLGSNEWEHKTWQMDAVVVPVSLPINPPEGP